MLHRITAGVQAAQMTGALKACFKPSEMTKVRLPAADLVLEHSITVIPYRSEQLQYVYFSNNFTANNFSAGFQIQIPLFDFGHRAKARESAAEALRATVEAEQAQRQNEVQIAELTGSLRELDALAEIASLKQQIADEQLKSVLAQLELGNGTGSRAEFHAAALAQGRAIGADRRKPESSKTRWTPGSTLPRRG